MVFCVSLNWHEFPREEVGTMHLTSAHVETCLCVKTSAGVGTCFFKNSKGRGGFLSAAHIFAGVVAGDYIYFREASDWLQFAVREIVRHPDGHDVCAFTIENMKWKALESDTTPVALWPGDPVRFLGFPHGLTNTYPSDTGFATPLTRHANLSGAIVHEGRPLTILDGFNNPGYSGGPVYAATAAQTPVLIGVISGYRNELREKSLVYRDNDDGTEEVVADHFVKPNSGMILAVPLNFVDEVFDLLLTSNAA